MKNTNKKGELHPNNPHKGKYDFEVLSKNIPQLKEYIRKNPRGEDTIDFSDNEAVILLNKALLKTFYNIDNWDIPKSFLVPPIPGRADYIHYIAELLEKKDNVKVLDIGTGANCIYPIIGSQSYGWNFLASDIDSKSIENAQKIIDANKNLKDKIILKLQKNRDNIFEGIIDKTDRFDLTMCNPPFHSSLEAAIKANERKVSNLNKGNKEIKKGFNFGGQKAELWCNGGELLFLKKMAKESVKFSSQVNWFTSLVSDKDNIKPLGKLLEKLGAKEVKVLEMSQGQKISRVLAWKF
ncbi:MAG: 23S rRNA (adenine(1618)-N(6))-methyltransferase RlmF [Fusobacteriaceae bacterium]|nr:23S rRNA (adenine(1618)-N(6))-methyltransferase RlmF [Fusobacteriaceae bacterium]MBP6467671.1 23S rRNA (adenine(1618)-N(6))-methyltransferase RlmF [Fusobacteriaceae bacterium]MBP9595267.1 23S rRNA (adenine(1618)-N(6))-methyltransferase RlmF [Fusobacteriaceae bacterium]MBU9918790.1 23S rRNA (adenine(1618)-N(6))-methyltransferase RlmF [Fusobacteriaceae bacterium]